MGWLGRIGKFFVRFGRRIGVTILGFALILLGILLLVLPGPGMLTIVAGVAVLATEFTWAAWLLRHIKRHAISATRLAMRRVKALERLPFLRRYAHVLERELEEMEGDMAQADEAAPDDEHQPEPEAMADRGTG